MRTQYGRRAGAARPARDEHDGAAGTAALVLKCATACTDTAATSPALVDELMSATVAQYSAQLDEMTKLNELCTDFCRRFSSE